jgi:hypothetical protein
MTQTDARVSELVARLSALERERAEIVAEINALRSAPDEGTAAAKGIPSGEAGFPTDRHSPIEQKIALFRRLFRGRADVFPIRWENRSTGRSGYAPACANEWQRGICEKPKIKCSACANQAFQAVDDGSIERHLRGTGSNGSPFVMGVYPMLADNTCSFLAADFDEGEWRRDVFAFRETCERQKIPVAIERSRSGNGAHAWIFFQEPIPAASARRLGAFLITDTMERVPDIGFGSYDRFFPSQDSMPAGGFGNLIALPLQGLARSSGNSVFIDESCSPYLDQWAFLSAINPIARAKVEHLIEEASAIWKNSRRAYSSRRRRRRTVACPAVAPTAATSNRRATAKCDHRRTGGPDLHPASRATTVVDRPPYSPRCVPESRILCRTSNAPIDPRQTSDHLLCRVD